MSHVIVPMIQVYGTRSHLRRLLAKARGAYPTATLMDQQLRLEAEAEHDFVLPSPLSIAIVLPTTPIDLVLTNLDGTMRLRSVDRLFVCPAQLTGLRLINTSTTSPADVQVILG